ncbi:5'-nucleotidase [Mesosutterella sp. AGMB02718]|uniref:5'-nucleotidase n=1 Tax=Mesosutterella faecium TaxID=2925194 RepID=A0ABT7IKD8_9BURK|nr:5'-nucleotidase [Mesosutterella sp. AGMB02718]MDL2058834.1 5'-nucleotidase [Mesosutterella sp. AGMB02718]
MTASAALQQRDKQDKLIVAVSSRALFDLEKEHGLFETKGVSAYRKFQIAHMNEPLKPGVAFPFISRLLKLNEIFPEKSPVRVVVLSRNSPETGQRFFNSCRYYKLPITTGAFTSGQSTFPFLQAFNACLFLSANRQSVIQANACGLPAGLVLPSRFKDTEQDAGLRIAFDFDGVIADDEAERKFQTEGIQAFQRQETDKRLQPLKAGPLQTLFSKLSEIQKLDAEKGKNDPYYLPALRIAIVTSRGAPSEQRLITTLKSFGMYAAELFLMDGLPKDRVLEVLKPHIFFDDQLRHLTSESVPSVLVPFGINSVTLD